MFSYDTIKTMVELDFDSFVFNTDNASLKKGGYARTKFVKMASKLTMDWQKQGCPTRRTTQDYIHGLCHIFWLGVSAGEVNKE